MIEEWKDVKGFNGYQISNKGRVRSFKRNFLHYLTLYKDKDGYCIAVLSKEKKAFHKKVHRLVAEAFLDNYSKDLQVNHKDENKENNNVSNLEMCTNKYNCNYGSRHTKLAFPIIQLDLKNNFIKEWISSREIERVLGFAHSAIINCCKGFDNKNINIKQAYGFKWKFKYERNE